MRFFSLFAGIGGFDLGLERAGHECVGQIEIDGFCGRVLAARWPAVLRWGDVRTVWSDEQGRRPDIPPTDGGLPGDSEFHGATAGIDLLNGGFPCQDLSVAGKRAGLGGERSGLFWEIVRLAKALRPPWGLLENVPGLVSSHRGRDMEAVLAGLRECWPAVGYRVLDSQHFGVAQRRRRVFFVCGPDERRVAEILFEPAGGGGHPAAGGEATAGVAASLTSGAHGVGVNGPGRRAEDDVNLMVTDPLTSGPYADNEAQHRRLIVGALSGNKDRGGWRAGPDEAAAGHCIVSHPLKAEGADASEDGTGRGVPMVISGRERGDDGRGYAREPNISFLPALDTSKPDRVAGNFGVRRLTPTECERLQGFPDGWTCLCQPLGAYDHRACRCPDSPRYRALGNAVTVNVIEWLGRRLAGMDVRS